VLEEEELQPLLSWAFQVLTLCFPLLLLLVAEVEVQVPSRVQVQRLLVKTEGLAEAAATHLQEMAQVGLETHQ
jgi:hypothetical protein